MPPKPGTEALMMVETSEVILDSDEKAHGEDQEVEDEEGEVALDKEEDKEQEVEKLDISEQQDEEDELKDTDDSEIVEDLKDEEEDEEESKEDWQESPGVDEEEEKEKDDIEWGADEIRGEVIEDSEGEEDVTEEVIAGDVEDKEDITGPQSETERLERFIDTEAADSFTFQRVKSSTEPSVENMMTVEHANIVVDSREKLDYEEEAENDDEIDDGRNESDEEWKDAEKREDTLEEDEWVDEEEDDKEADKEEVQYTEYKEEEDKGDTEMEEWEKKWEETEDTDEKEDKQGAEESTENQKKIGKETEEIERQKEEDEVTVDRETEETDWKDKVLDDADKIWEETEDTDRGDRETKDEKWEDDGTEGTGWKWEEADEEKYLDEENSSDWKVDEDHVEEFVGEDNEVECPQESDGEVVDVSLELLRETDRVEEFAGETVADTLIVQHAEPTEKIMMIEDLDITYDPSKDQGEDEDVDRKVVEEEGDEDQAAYIVEDIDRILEESENEELGEKEGEDSEWKHDEKDSFPVEKQDVGDVLEEEDIRDLTKNEKDSEESEWKDNVLQDSEDVGVKGEGIATEYSDLLEPETLVTEPKTEKDVDFTESKKDSEEEPKAEVAYDDERTWEDDEVDEVDVEDKGEDDNVKETSTDDVDNINKYSLSQPDNEEEMSAEPDREIERSEEFLNEEGKVDTIVFSRNPASKVEDEEVMTVEQPALVVKLDDEDTELQEPDLVSEPRLNESRQEDDTADAAEPADISGETNEQFEEYGPGKSQDETAPMASKDEAVISTGAKVEEFDSEPKKKGKKKKKKNKKKKKGDHDDRTPRNEPHPSGEASERSEGALKPDDVDAEEMGDQKNVEDSKIDLHGEVTVAEHSADDNIVTDNVEISRSGDDVQYKDSDTVVEDSDVQYKDSEMLNDDVRQSVDSSDSQLDTRVDSLKDVDRQEELLPETPSQELSGRLLEDVISNKARAEEVVSQSPEASQARLIHDTSSSSGEATLTPAGHLMSEMGLLETSARDQLESLQLAVAEQEKYDTEIRQLNTAISEAQQKLLASPVMATSVGALKQQIAEHNIGLDPEVRERSSSFGAEVTPVGRPLGQAQAEDTVRELNVSWNTLQEQVQSKERELQAALQRQERYQHHVQELTAKMERANIRLAQSPASVAAPLEVQMKDYKETLAEIESIRGDIAKVKDMGQQLMDSPDTESHKAMEATLTMLADRFDNLQAMAEAKGRQLQEAMKHKEKHGIAEKAYRKRVQEIRDWLEEKKVRQASITLPSEDPAVLQAQLDENREIQEDINNHLRQLSDLALQCDSLCENESPITAEKLRNELVTLQNNLGQLKTLTIEKQSQLRAAIKDAEKRRREREEVDSNVQKLQKWMSDTKELTMASGGQATALAPGQRDIHKELATDIKKHKQLVRQISDHRLRSAPATTASDREIRESWERLSRDLAQKTQNLETILRTRKPGELAKISLHAPARHADSARQLEEVKDVMADLGQCWNQLQTQLRQKQLRLDEALTFQQQYQSALQNVSSWLDLAQQQLFTVPSTTEEHIRQNENLQKQIRSLQSEVKMISEQAEELLESTESANQDLIEKCLGSLNDRVKLLEDTAQAQAQDLRAAERQWKQYQDEVAELQRRLQDTQKLVLAPASAQSLEQLMSNNQKIEAQLKKCETQLEELKSKESTLTQAYPKGVFPSELTTLQSNYMELHRRAMEKKAMLQKSVSVQDQYQKMLKDYAVFLDTAQEKLRNDSISARDLNHLKQQLAAHKDFFSDLEVHKAMLDSLAGQCDAATRARFQQQHSSLSNLTHVLVDQASLHGQRLERLTRQWTELDEKYVRLQKMLSSIESQVPQPIVSGDSLTTIQDKLSKFKRLQSELADERNTVFEVVDKGKQILHSINCPTLETAITDLADKWVSLNTDLTHELKRTETLGDQLSIFETEAAVLTSWLSTAKMKLASFKQLSPSDMQNIGAIRTKVEKVLEFHKEVENQQPLKERVITVGNQLLQNKNYDTRGLSDRLTVYEEEWVKLGKGIAETQEFLHQAQMELMPSRQALNELTAWIEEINKSLKQDANKRIKTVADIEVMVKKYKGYKIELASKQMTLDFVNQEVLAPQPEEVDIPHEKLEFAEKLGELNKQWKKAVKDVNDRLNTLEGLQSKWEEYEKALERLQAWFHEQEDRIKRYKLIGHEVGVKQTLKDCKAMQQQLQSKQSDLAAIRALGNHLIEVSQESPGCQQSVKDSLTTLDQNWRRLEEQTRQLENLLTDMLGQWARYHTDLASLNQVLTQTEYALNHYTLIGGDIATLRSQVAKLKNLQAELNNNSSHLESFSVLAGQLRQVCEPPVQVDIQKTVSDIQTKWKQLSSDLAARCRQFEDCLNQWEDYENLYSKIRDWLNAKEALCTDLINMRDDPMRRPESLAKCKQLQQELDNIQGQVSELYRMSDQLTKNMNPSTIAIITSRQSDIEQRMLALRQVLSQHTSTLTDDLSQLGRFNEAFDVVEKFLASAERILAPDDPTKAAEEEEIQSRLDQLKQLLLLFNTNYVKLDAVNDLGYRLALNETDATRLRELNHKWQRLYEDASDRSRTLQGNLLVQQDFTSKCETWMTFLAQTEQDLAKEVKGNLADLKDQLRKCEQFESEMYSRQQILHAIISDGQKMMRAGEVEDEEEFQQKLHLLAEQWQSVSRRANQRKAIIESMISQWQQFNSLSNQLRDWLQDKEDAMRAFEFDSDSLQVIRNLVEKVQAIKHEFKIQEATFKKIHDLGNTLLQHADHKAAEEIKDTLSDLQRRWYQVFSTLDDHRSRLDGVDRQWLECEDDIEDLLNWLKDIRRILHADIPTSFDELQADMNRCRDIATDFMNSEDKRQRLLAKEKQLGRLVQTEDMNLLHQRIRLLNKQWEELQHQTHIREQRLTEALFRWTNLGERIRSMMEWMEEMQVKVISNRDMHVEDLLAMLENEYKQEMEAKEVQKDDILEQGRQLMKVSSEIRASDIEQKLLRLEDKWQHLKGIMDFRHRKLQETVLAVKQLDTSMKNLSRWLSAVESELSGGISYKDSGFREIQTKLQASQELQEDIERHSAGVSAVLNLCEVLLHDSDACPTETEFMALQHAMKNLEKRWRNICALSPQRRNRVEETWELWESFREDCRRFSDWLSQAELDVRNSEIEIPNVKVAKKEIKKYEDLQRNVHDHLGDLEHINRQYRQLAKEGRTDTDGSIKVMMTELNNRWDALQLRVTEIMKQLRHSASIREDFETTRTSLITWLREVDIQLSNLQHLSSLDLETKVLEIRRIEDEVHTKRHRMEYLDQAGVYLMQKGDSHEAIRVQGELDEFRKFCKKVLDRVVTTQLQIERMVVAQVEDITTIYGEGEDSRYFSSAADRIQELRDMQSTLNLEQQTADLERYLAESPPESPPVIRRPDASPSRVSLSPSRRTGSPARRPGSPVQRSESPSPLRSRSPTRKSVSPTRRFSPSPTRRSPSPAHMGRDVIDGRASPRLDLSQLEKNAKIEVLLEQLVDSLDDCNVKLARLEKAMGPYGDAEHCMQLLVECEVAVDTVQRLDRLLKTETGVSTIASADAQVRLVLQRWERLQRRALDQNYRSSQERQDLVKFANDIESMLAWLDEAEALQSTHRPLPSDIDRLDVVARQYKDFLVQLESRKAVVLSINLLSKKYLSAKTAETRQLKGKLNEMNRRWELVLTRATDTQRDLQHSLMQCQGFHRTIHDYQLWLESMETRVRQCEPVTLNAEEAALWDKYTRLVDIHSELQLNQTKVASLKETADQLLVSSDSPEMSTARDKAYIIHNRLRTLLNLTSSYISSLENKLQIAPKRGSASSSFDLSDGRSSGLGSSHPSRSSTPLRSLPPSLRSRTRSPYAITRQLISGIMRPLLRTSTQDRDNLSTELEETEAASHLVERRVRPALLMRVIRAALPIQLLLLLLFLLFCLIPVCEDEYSCLLTNNLRHTVSPMLRYTDGAPPI